MKLAALQKQASDEKQGKLARAIPSAEMLTMATSASARSGESNSIELDYYGDRSAANPDNRRPLSPNLITLQESANNAFERDRPITGANDSEKGSTPSSFALRSRGESMRGLKSDDMESSRENELTSPSNLYDGPNISVLGFVQTDDNDNENNKSIDLDEITRTSES